VHRKRDLSATGSAMTEERRGIGGARWIQWLMGMKETFTPLIFTWTYCRPRESVSSVPNIVDRRKTTLRLYHSQSNLMRDETTVVHLVQCPTNRTTATEPKERIEHVVGK
jgi:hypothetical protein